MSIFIAILVLSLLIIVHEIGHFTAAKLLGVRVLEFSLFMGPRLFSFTKGETRYSVKLIPVGGSCLMDGEDRESDENDDKALYHKPKWARAVIFAAGPFMNVFTAFIMILVLNLSVGFVSCELSAVAENSPATTASVRLAAGDEIISYAGKRVHVPSDIFVYLQETKGAPVDMTFRRGGELIKSRITPDFTPGIRYILGFTGAEPNGPDWSLIVDVTEGEPAETLGLRPGDRLQTVNGRTPADRLELRGILAEAGGGEVEITWTKPDGSAASGRIEPKLTNGQDYYSLGVSYVGKERPGIFESIRYAYHNCISFSKMVLYSLKWMITGAVGVDQVSGVVGIVAEIGAGVEETSKSQYGVTAVVIYLLQLSALIGINLGLFNLIPFPPLDGSKLLLLGVEAVRRKDIPLERQAVISMIGFGVLILVMLLTVFNDIFRLISR